MANIIEIDTLICTLVSARMQGQSISTTVKSILEQYHPNRLLADIVEYAAEKSAQPVHSSVTAVIALLRRGGTAEEFKAAASAAGYAGYAGYAADAAAWQDIAALMLKSLQQTKRRLECQIESITG